MNFSPVTVQTPISECSQSCGPGFRKTVWDMEPIFCFDYVQCSVGEISNKTGKCLDRNDSLFLHCHRNRMGQELSTSYQCSSQCEDSDLKNSEETNGTDKTVCQTKSTQPGVSIA